MFFVLPCDKETFSVHDMPLIWVTRDFFTFFEVEDDNHVHGAYISLMIALYFWISKLFFFSLENNFYNISIPYLFVYTLVQFLPKIKLQHFSLIQD